MLYLPATDLDGQVVWSSWGRVNADDLGSWAGDLDTGADLYAVIVALDAEKDIDSDAVARLQAELERAIERGLEERAGRVLSRDELNTYLQLAARVDVGARRWQVCECCEVAFKLRRLMEHASYRCPDCKGKRLTPVRAPSSLRQCWTCDALFEPSDPQQRTCPSCQRGKSTRSRHPTRPVIPGTPLRRVEL